MADTQEVEFVELANMERVRNHGTTGASDINSARELGAAIVVIARNRGHESA